MKKKIAIAGASGFIGRHLIEDILQNTDHHVVALSRQPYESENSHIEFRQANLYSLLELEKALDGCDTAIYLVHSMANSSRLAQGSFNDFDFVLADNFARACKHCGVKQIFYVGGIIPSKSKLSVHLESRKEVEDVLASTSIPTLAVRCGLIIGPGGSSFGIVQKLVRRLPVMVLPYWSATLNQPIFIDDLIGKLNSLIQTNEPLNGAVDFGGPEKLSYADLIKKTAKASGSVGLFIHFKYVPLALSKLWVRVITGYSKQLVYPLIDSLVHEMVAQPSVALKNVKIDQTGSTSIDQALKESIEREKNNSAKIFSNFKKATHSKTQQIEQFSEVQSVQRLPLPHNKSVAWVAQAYLDWLPKFSNFFLYAVTEGEICSIYSKGVKKPMLVLEHSEARSSKTRHLFYVRKGLLVSNKVNYGRLEFRADPNGEFVISAIHRFVPSLPWYIYRFTQAVVHKFVMWRFGVYLKKIN